MSTMHAPGVDDVRYFNAMDTKDISKMFNEHSVVRGAFDLRFQHIRLDQMQITDAKGVGPGKLLNSIVSENWARYSRITSENFFKWGFSPYKVVRRKVFDRGDELRAQKFGTEVVKKNKKVTVLIPMALGDGMYTAVMRLLDGVEIEIFCVDRYGKRDKTIHVLRSQNSMPNWKESTYNSEASCLLRDVRQLEESLLIYRNVVILNANPAYFAERAVQSDSSYMASQHAVAANRALDNHTAAKIGKDGTVVESKEVEVTSKMTVNEMSEKLLVHRQWLDRTDALHIIPAGHKMSSQGGPGPTAVEDIHRLIETLELRIALVMKIPITYIRSITGSMKVATTGETEMMLLATHLSLVVKDLTAALLTTWRLVFYKHKYDGFDMVMLESDDEEDDEEGVRIHLPITGITNAEFIQLLFDRGVIPEHVAKEELLQSAHIDKKRIGDDHMNNKRMKTSVDLEVESKLRQNPPKVKKKKKVSQA